MNSRLALALGLLAFAGCGDFERGDPLPTVESPTPTNGGMTYAFDVHPILVDFCEDCHRSGGDASSSEFLMVGDVETDYESALAWVDIGAPASSRLLTKARGTGHTGGVVLVSSSEEYLILFEWIAEGAPP